jgi:hypothetical protein
VHRLREAVDAWFLRQPAWRRGAVVGASAYAIFSLAFTVPEVFPWPGADQFLLHTLRGVAFAALCGGAAGAAYGAVLGWRGSDRWGSHMLAGTVAVAIFAFPGAFLLRAALGAWWPVYAGGASVLIGGVGFAPFVRDELRARRPRRSRRSVA